MFKSAISAVACTTVAAIGCFAPEQASASTSYCYRTELGDSVCILSVQKHRTNPFLKKVTSVVNNRSYFTNLVTCNPAHRYNYVQNVAGIACFQFD